jgi:methyl-accepting chemotaxis protein
MKSIKTKLIISISLVVVLVTLVVGLISIAIGYQSLEDDAEYSLKLLAEQGAKLTESRMDSIVSILTMIARKTEVKNTEWEVNLQVLKEELDKTNFIDIGYVLPNGYTYYSDGTVRLMSDRTYIKEALNGKAEISGVIISRVTRRPEIEVAVPVFRDGKVTGALVGRMEADSLSTITKDIVYGEKGYSFMIDGKGTVIAHPEAEKVVERFNPIEAAKDNPEISSLSEVYQEIIGGLSGTTGFTNDGSSMYAGYATIEGTDWHIIITANREEVMAAIPKMVRVILTVMLIVLAFSLCIVFLLDIRLTKPLIVMTKQSEHIAELDIRQDIDEVYLKQKDEIGTLSRAFQTLTSNLREIIINISGSANQVSDTAQKLADSSRQSSLVSEEISHTMEDIARGAAEQAVNTEAGLSRAELLNQKLAVNHLHMIDLNSTTDQVTKIVYDGLKDIERLRVLTEENDLATKKAYDNMMDMKNNSLQIGDASSIISEMARQTNLLALNASIEAARAGEAGRGFAVVAEEIQKMADQSARSSLHIDAVVAELHHHITHTADSMKQILVASGLQQKSVTATIQKYQDISQSMKQSEIAVAALNSSELDMENANKEIKEMLQSMSAIAEQNAAGTKQTASTLEEQTASAAVIADISDRLTELAQNLRTTITRFEI